MDVIYWKSRFESSPTFIVCHLFSVSKAVKTATATAILKTNTLEVLKKCLILSSTSRECYRSRAHPQECANSTIIKLMKLYAPATNGVA